MLEFLFGKKEQETARDVNLNKIYDELKKAYPFDSIPELRKNTCPCTFKSMGI